MDTCAGVKTFRACMRDVSQFSVNSIIIKVPINLKLQYRFVTET